MNLSIRASGTRPYGTRNISFGISTKLHPRSRITAKQSLSSAVVRGIFQNSSIYLTAFLFLRSTTLTHYIGGLMSVWRGSQLTGAENRRKRNSLRDCIEQKKTYPAAASSSMQHSRLSASWTKSFAMFKLRPDCEK